MPSQLDQVVQKFHLCDGGGLHARGFTGNDGGIVPAALGGVCVSFNQMCPNL